MKGLYKYLLIFLVTACYLQAALELNIGPLTNTFDDIYDTYVQADDLSTVQSQKTEKSFDFVVLPTQAICEQPICLLGSDYTTTSYNANEPYYKKRYIFFCTLLI